MPDDDLSLFLEKVRIANKIELLEIMRFAWFHSKSFCRNSKPFEMANIKKNQSKKRKIFLLCMKIINVIF